MNKVKTGLIFLLSGLAIYLTSQLWFVKISSRNFFYYMLEHTHTQPHNLENERNFAWPYRLITNYGSNRFTIQYSGLSTCELREICDGIIVSLLRDGVHIGTQELDYDGILSSRGYIFEYAFNMPLSALSMAYGRAFSDDLTHITSIAFLPSNDNHEETIVWLLDEENLIMSGYSVPMPLPPVTGGPPRSDQIIIYNSSILSGHDFGSRNVFIAGFTEEGYRYPILNIVNPYAENELLMNVIEQHINVFFENPSAKRSFMGEHNVYTYVDGTTVVRYFQNNVLEYSKYRTGVSEVGLIRSFNIALNFIESDAFVVDEFYLAGFEQIDNEFFFYFDYVIENLPLILPDEYIGRDLPSGHTTINHAIEVTVREGLVVNYRKIVYNFIPDTISHRTRLDFESVLPGILAPLNETEESISSIVLGYKIEQSQTANLYWAIHYSSDDQYLFKRAR